jgi:Sporulation and spore germination/L,D-transpeptidase catalytic domain/Putative peptidoglycan binding domain
MGADLAAGGARTRLPLLSAPFDRAGNGTGWSFCPSDDGAEHGYVRRVTPRIFNAERIRASGRGRRCRRLAAAVAAAALTGCGGATADTAAPGAASAPAGANPSAATPVEPRRRAVTVFFVKGEQFVTRSRTVPRGESAAAAAVRALLAGPTAAERAAGIQTTVPARTTLVSLRVRAGTATVELRRPQEPSTAFDVSLRPARAAQIVYTLTADATIRHVVIRVNGAERATFIGSRLALKGPLGKHDLSRPITLPAEPRQVPKGHAPADPRGVQHRLAALGYLPAGATTARWDARTSQAVLAFQAWEGLARDAIVGPETIAALENAARPKPSRAKGGARHVEVHRDRGVTLLVEHGVVVQALHSSSGAARYATPAGSFSIFRKERNSWSVPYQVWLPYASYFNGGIAFHAYSDVPARPASHGCVRLPVSEAPFAYAFMAIGTPVTVY